MATWEQLKNATLKLPKLQIRGMKNVIVELAPPSNLKTLKAKIKSLGT
jgi:hypothetical protein